MKNKVEELIKKYPSEVNLITLKALFSIETTAEVELARTNIISILIQKYPEDSEMKLLKKGSHKNKKIDEILTLLKIEYPNEVDVISLLAINELEENEEKTFAIIEILKRLKNKYPDNYILSNILNYSEGDILMTEEYMGIDTSNSISIFPNDIDELKNLIDNFLKSKAINLKISSSRRLRQFNIISESKAYLENKGYKVRTMENTQLIEILGGSLGKLINTVHLMTTYKSEIEIKTSWSEVEIIKIKGED